MPKNKSNSKPAAPGRADALAAAVNPPPAEAVQLESIAVFRGLTLAELSARIKSSAASVSSAHVLTGKMVSAMDDRRAGKGTLKAYIRKETGIELEPAGFKCAVAFGMVGEGHGHCAESDYDSCKLRWLLTVSAILNVIADDADETFVAQVCEQVAVVMRERKENAGKLLEAIYKAIKPAKEKSDGAGDGDDEEEAPVAVDFLAGIPAFTGAWYRAMGDALAKHEDPAAVEMATNAFRMLQTIAEGRREELAAVQPAALAA